MTTFAWDIPGYVQGHRFANNARRYWDANRFRDLAGYDHLGNGVSLVAGTPVFATHGPNNRIGLKLDNTTTFKFHSATSWEGSYLFVFKTVIGSSGTVTLNPWIWGTISTIASLGHIGMTMSVFANNTSFFLSTASARVSMSFSALPLGQILICAFSLNQADRIPRMTRDGVTITTFPVEPGDVGDALAIGGNSGVPPIPDIGGISNDYVRLGDLTADGSLTPNAAGHHVYVFEQHFWKYDLLRDYAPSLADFINDLEDYYGI